MQNPNVPKVEPWGGSDIKVQTVDHPAGLDVFLPNHQMTQGDQFLILEIWICFEFRASCFEMHKHLV
jgi:hypothetical protein